MRGVAAFAVVLLHIGQLVELPIVHHGYLAVDFFFALSGFVLTTTYAPRFARGLTPGDFLKQRFIRLYPTFLAGVVVGIPVVFAQIYFGSGHALPMSVATVGAGFNLLMLPAPGADTLFPFDRPAWSLFFELLANVALCYALLRITTKLLVAVCAISGFALLFAIMRYGSADIGHNWDQILFGLSRTSFSFCLGVLAARRPIFRATSYSAILLLAALAIILQLDVAAQYRWVYDAVGIFFILPIVAILGTGLNLPPSLHRDGSFLGDISYPLYAVHYPVIQALSFVLLKRSHTDALTAALILLLAACSAAAFIAFFYDGRARKWLTAALISRRPVQQVPTVADIRRLDVDIGPID